VSPAANEREQGVGWQVADDIVVALLGVGEGQARVAGTDPPGHLAWHTGALALRYRR
jgi:hypothetical protein